MKPLVALCLTLAAAPVGAGPVDDILAEAEKDCASFENGLLTVGPGAVTEAELTGEGTPETVVDWSAFQCSTMASAWGGTGGSLLTVVAGGVRHDFLTLGWTVADLGGPVLVLALHGSECGGSGVDRCAEALVWSGGRFLSVRSPAPPEEDAGEGAAP